MRLIAFVSITAALLGLAGSAAAFPQPSLVRQSWELDVEVQTPRTIAVRGLDGKARWYWFMQYKVTNRTDTEQFFVPDITIATDQGDIITAGRGVRASVFLSIRKQLGNPLLENPIRMAGRMLIGEDHARESVAIWPVFESDVDRMKLFVAGLSGETRMIRHPLDGKEVVLRKTLMMVYHTPGSDTRPQVQPIRLRRKTWVMR